MTKRRLSSRADRITPNGKNCRSWARSAYLVLGCSGYFKGSRAAALLPVDLTVLGIVATGGFVLFRALHGHLPTRLVTVVLVVWGTFLPAAFVAPGGAAADRKLLLLFTATLLCALGPMLIDERGLKIWIYGQLVASGAMALLLWTNRDSAVAQQLHRLANEEVATITSARMLGAGVLILSLLAVHVRRLAAPCLGAALVGVGLMLDVGSRGPVLSLVFVLVLLAAATRFSDWRWRLASVVLVSAAVAGFLSYVTSSRSDAVRRIGGFISGDYTDTSRTYLYGISTDLISHHPLGIGWGGFARLPSVAPFVNSQGSAYPHNLFLEVGVEGGWLAMGAVAAYCVVCLRKLRRTSFTLTGRLVFGLAIYWLLVAQTSSDVNGNRMTWIALSMALVYSESRLSERQPRVSSPEFSTRRDGARAGEPDPAASDDDPAGGALGLTRPSSGWRR